MLLTWSTDWLFCDRLTFPKYLCAYTCSCIKSQILNLPFTSLSIFLTQRYLTSKYLKIFAQGSPKYPFVACRWQVAYPLQFHLTDFWWFWSTCDCVSFTTWTHLVICTSVAGWHYFDFRFILAAYETPLVSTKSKGLIYGDKNKTKCRNTQL